MMEEWAVRPRRQGWEASMPRIDHKAWNGTCGTQLAQSSSVGIAKMWDRAQPQMQSRC